MKFSGFILVAFALLSVPSCTKADGKSLDVTKTEEVAGKCPIRVRGVIDNLSGYGTRVVGSETKNKDYALSWELGDVLSACWKDSASKWHKVYFEATELDKTTGFALFTYKSGDIPTAEGTVVSAVSLGNATQLDFVGDKSCTVDFSNQSSSASPVLLFSKSTIKNGSLSFSFAVMSAFIRIAGLKGLPDLDFQGVTDYFPEVKVSGSSLGTKGTLGLTSDGSLSLSVNSTGNQEIILSRSKGLSGSQSARQFEFKGGREENIIVSVLPFTSNSAAKTDLKVTASAVYGSYSKTLAATSAAIAARDYIHIDDTLKLLPPALKSQYDENRPVGFGNCRKDSDKIITDYVLDGGRRGKRTVVLTATGDDGTRIEKAIYNNDIIILDGSKGDFVFKNYVKLANSESKRAMVANKTVVGVNNAYLRTEFHLTQAMVDKLNNAGLKGLSQSPGTGGSIYDPADKSGFYDRWKGKNIKSDGTEYNVTIDNAMELMSRRAMIDILEDPLESYRDKSGIFRIFGAQNFIMRNLRMRAAGAVDANGQDCICLTIKDEALKSWYLECACNHVWIDHCDLSDGMDGNLDNNGNCDFISITWTEQHYGSLNYGHKFSCLMAGGEAKQYIGKQHYTFQFCKWGDGINCRTPMMRYGTAHMLNNYYAYYGGAFMIESLTNATLFLDGCYFVNASSFWISKRSLDAEGSSIVLKNNYNLPSADQNKARGSVSIPYAYNTVAASSVKSIVDAAVGPTLTNPLDY